MNIATGRSTPHPLCCVQKDKHTRVSVYHEERGVMCTKDFLRARARAGGRVSGRAARLRTWSRTFCTSSTSVPRAASAASSCSCTQRCVASPVGPWAGGARAGLTGAVRGAAAAHAIDAVLLLHHERQHVVLLLPCDRRRPWRRVVHLVARRARMLERAWRGSMEWGRVPPPRAARRARAATRPCSCVCARRAASVLRFICDRHTHLTL